MSFLINWLWSKPTAPERVPSDIVIPLHALDDTHSNRNVAIDFTMRFDEVLDAEKLADALWILLEKPGWRKLGARLRLNEKGKLEYHVPAQFTKDRPPINFTKAKYDIPLAQHPIGAKVPVADGTFQSFVVDDFLRRLTVPEDGTSTMVDWIYADKAQFGLHVVNFSDATLVTLTWLHSLLDALGRHALLQAWVAVLDGRDEDVPEFWGYDFDPLKNLGATQDDGISSTSAQNPAAESNPKEQELVRKDQLLKGFQFFRFILNVLWEVIMYPQEQKRQIIMPASYFAKIKAQAYRDLDSAPSSLLTTSASNPTKPFLSDGDIIAAWMTRLSASSNPSVVHGSPARTITIFNIFGLRELLTKTSPQLLPLGKAYVANCVSMIQSLFTQREFLSLPLGHIAAHIRRDLVLQGTRAQVNATHRFTRSSGGNPPLYGTSDMVVFAMSNWLKGKFFQVDFSAAVVDAAGAQVPVRAEKNAARGKPQALIVHTNTGKWFPLRGSTAILGQDHDGNYWLGAMIRKDSEELFNKAVKELK